MNRLLNIGFTKVGHWELTNEVLTWHLEAHNTTKNMLYCFISNEVIKYISRTTTNLAQRMGEYQNSDNSHTKLKKIRTKIVEHLKENKGQSLDIFIFVDNGKLKYGDFSINLAAGLKDSLLDKISPEWNNEETRQSHETKEINQEKSTLEKSEVIHQVFNIKLGTAYYNQGFFNVSQQYSSYFGADRELIEIKLGEDSIDNIKGVINRTANNNGTPRIMGGKELTNWIQCHFKQGDILRVELLTKGVIMLHSK